MISRQQSPKRSQGFERGIFKSKGIKQKELKLSAAPYSDTSFQGLKTNIQNLKARGNYNEEQKNENLKKTALFSHAHHINNQGSSFQSQNNPNNFSPFSNREVPIEEQRRSFTRQTTFNHQENRNFLPGIQEAPIQSGLHNFQNPQQVNHNHQKNGSNELGAMHRAHNIHRPHQQVLFQGGIQTGNSFGPIHVFNEVPARMVINTETMPHQTRNIQNNNDEAYEVLLNEYEKLFQKLQTQQQTVQQLQHQVFFLRAQLNSQDQSHRFELNLVQLHDRLYSLYLRNVEDVLGRRKQRAKIGILDLVNNARREVSYWAGEVNG